MSDNLFMGVYSLRPTPDKLSRQKQFYFAWKSTSAFIVQALNSKLRPEKEPESIRASDFASHFILEPSILVRPEKNVPDTINRIVNFAASEATLHTTSEDANCDKIFEDLAEKIKNDTNSEKNAKRIELFLRDQFEQDILRISSPIERKKAEYSLQKIAEFEIGVNFSHRHMFNEFGIALRRVNLLQLALFCCIRVVNMSPSDENAHFNAARVLFEMGRFDEAESYLRLALKLQPTMRYARDFLELIEEQRIGLLAN